MSDKIPSLALFDQLALMRNYYKIKRQFSIGSFWRRGWRTKLKATAQSQHISPMILDDDGILYPSDSNDHVTNGVLYRGDGIKEIRWVLKRYIAPGSLAIDIGTNVGYVAALMARCVEAGGQVWCFEPNVSLHEQIKKLFWLNRWKQYRIFDIGLSNAESTVGFEINADHSMSKISTANNKTGMQIQCKPLDALISEIDRPLSLIKVDVEGHELAVLEGAKAVLLQYKPALIFESGLHDQVDALKLEQTLEASGYRIAGIIQEWGLIPCESLIAINDNKRHLNLLALPI